MNYPLNFYTSYSQFYICDKNKTGNTGSDSFWTDDAFNDRLAIESGILGVGTECYGPIKGELEILSIPKTRLNLDDYDHIVEAGIEIESGIIQIIDCPSSNLALEINIKPGIYRARIYSSKLASVDGDEGDDFYKIEIWPDSKMDRNVIKRYKAID
jgi:hypothetical protein